MKNASSGALAALVYAMLWMVGFVFAVFGVIGAFILGALLTMGFWAATLWGLGWLIPGMMGALRDMAHLSGFAFWEIGAGIGFVLFLISTAIRGGRKG